MAPHIFNGKLAIQQRVLPDYRKPFFDALASACTHGLSVYAGKARPNESIVMPDHLDTAQYTPAKNFHLFEGPFYLCWQTDILRWLDDWQPDALIMEANPRYLNTPRAIQWMHQRDLPVIGWGLGAPPITGFLSSQRKRSRANLITKFDAMIAYSQNGAEEYIRLGIPENKVFVARNAVSPRPTHLMPDRPLNFAGKPIVLFVGRLQARKRVDFLLNACAALPQNLQPRLVIAGDGPERLNLETLAGSIYPQAEFTGDLRGKELEDLFISADLFVLPGTGGLAIQQAMSYGLPIIVARGDGTQNDLVRVDNGWRIPNDDIPSLVAALKNAVSDPARLRQMGQVSYRIVSEEINIEAMVDIFLQALASVYKGK
jgi:glycosyltransferase involved in cell wall biosynthesis